MVERLELFLASVLGFEIPLHTQSAFNPSVFTIEKFALTGNPADVESLRKGLDLTLILNLLFSGALFLAYIGKKDWGAERFVPTAIASATSAGVYAYYRGLVDRKAQEQPAQSIW